MKGLHPEIRKAVEAFEEALAEMGLDDIHTGGAGKAREFFTTLVPPVEVLPPINRVEDREIPGPGGAIPIRIYYPATSENFPVLMWFHGGGWVLGDIDTPELNCRRLANDVGCVVVSVDYRLAPEVPFPGAFDDCFAATAWVFENSDELKIDTRRIAVGGDSAGGNLAAGVAQRARQDNLQIVFQLLVYPVTDADFNRPSYSSNADGYLLTRNAMKWFWDCYVPDPEQRKNPAASPLRAVDLFSLAPALIITAEFDPLRDEGEAYGEALQAAGVAVEIRRFNGVIHGFFNTITEEPVEEILMASNEAANALRKAFSID